MRDRFAPHARRGRGARRTRTPSTAPSEALARARPGDREPLMARIEDYALLGDLQTAALVEPRRVDRLALLPPLRLRRLLRRAPRRARTRPLAARAVDAGDEHAPLPPRHARPRDDAGRPRTARSRASRLHAAARQGARHRPDRRGRRGQRPLPLGARRSASTTAASSRGCASAHEERHARRDRRARRALLPHPGADARRGHAHGLGVRGRRGRARPVRPHVVPVARRRSRADRPRAGARRHRELLARVERGVRGRAAARAGRRGAPLAHRAQGAHVPADRRHRRRADDVAAGVDRLAFATGTTATAGCATRRSRCSRSCTAPRRRGAAGGAGCCAPSRAIRPTSRSCTASPASGG